MSDQIAIVGLACRFPGAGEVTQFWDNLRGGVASIADRSEEELREAGVPPTRIADPDYVRAAALVADLAGFDADLFGYRPELARATDPQHRLFLECAHAALQNAGYDTGRVPGRAGVFGSAAPNLYGALHVSRDPAARAALASLEWSVGNENDYLATNVSHRLGLDGPSLAVATACSSALVAVHLAAQSLRQGDCDLALAGAADVQLPYGHGYLWHEGAIVSRTGRCRPFDAAADGTVFGSGAGVVALKRLADAVADRDHIYAVIGGSAVNNDGSRRFTFTSPGIAGQVELVQTALARAGLTAADLGYVECHGTGTTVGDPIEVEALTTVLAGRGDVPIGSVKGNIGHLGSAAGIAGLIKTALAIHNGQIPASAGFAEPNPDIGFDSSPCFVTTELRDWTQPRRVAGVSSFGIGGTNAHVVLTQGPAVAAEASARPRQLITVSGRTEAAANAAVRALAETVRANPDLDVADLAHTLHRGRAAHAHRRTLVATPGENLAQRLEELAVDGRPPAPRRPPAVAFLFPGQGEQYAGMGRELSSHEPVFRRELDRCADLLGIDLDHETLRSTDLAQPALFAVEYALAQLWMHWGVPPRALAGHSIGEYAAACVAGCFSLEDAAKLVVLRGELMASTAPGAMLAVPLPEDELRAELPDGVSIAAVNSARNTVASGPAQLVDQLRNRLTDKGIRCVPLPVDHAFHSALMDPILPKFRAALADIELHAPKIPVVSSVTGDWLTAEQARDPEYWVRQLSQPVRFADALNTLWDNGEHALLEVGPGGALSTIARLHWRETRTAPVPTIVSSMRHRADKRTDADLLLRALGTLWSAGVEPDWDTFWAEENRRRLPLPGYPYQRGHAWVDPDPGCPPLAGMYGVPLTAAEPPAEKTPLELPTWAEQPLDQTSVGVMPGEPWLVFTAGSPVVDQVLDDLRRAGATVVRAEPGTEFARRAPGRYTLRPADPADYDALLTELAAAGLAPRRIVHAWLLDEDSLEHGLFSLLALGRTLARRQISVPIALTILATGLHEVTGADPVAPAKATVLGPHHMVNQEIPNLSSRVVDLALPADARQVLAELAATDDQAALRGRRRWVREIRPLPSRPPQSLPALLRERGTYLITGGLGGIGLALAEDLARLVRARLVLVGRSSFPDRPDWDTYLAEGPCPIRKQTIRRFKEIEALGGSVLVRVADVADEQAMRHIRDTCGRIDGIFHAAGSPGGGMMAVRRREDVEAVLAPKITGTQILDRVFGQDPDFLVLFSSVTALVPTYYGQADYLAANAYLDAFAHASPPGPRHTVSVNWDAWSETGMLASNDPHSNYLRTSEGLDLLWRILAARLGPQVIAAPRGLAEVGREAAQRMEPQPVPMPAHHLAPVVREDLAEATGLQRTLLQLWEETLGVPDLDLDSDFFELGGNSLQATQLLARLREHLDVDLPAATLFDHSTIRALADELNALR
ncbi:beta-ketoacyl synthase N-terminal-like domain-containing protein [Amycolatopsis sp. cg13]|uniref:beta-ketoacyl synthase N-terminal-like domain-containing protein n=1 Tax=Amycolatopsis sp. cg13 TaxID=3238807 RepID=UPI0035233406